MLIYFEFQLKDGAHELHCWGFVAKGLRVSYKRWSAGADNQGIIIRIVTATALWWAALIIGSSHNFSGKHKKSAEKLFMLSSDCCTFSVNMSAEIVLRKYINRVCVPIVRSFDRWCRWGNCLRTVRSFSTWKMMFLQIDSSYCILAIRLPILCLVWVSMPAKLWRFSSNFGLKISRRLPWLCRNWKQS